MAPSRPRPSSLRTLRRLALAAPLALALAAHADAAAAPVPDKCNDPIDVNAKSFEADYKGSTTQMRNVVISQCDIRVEAEHASATGLNFDNTRWTFDGDVKVDVENRGSLRSDRAVVDFQNSQIAKVTINGSPAEFEQRENEKSMVARGHAGEIVYEVGPGTVRLANDAWLKYGTTEMKGSSLVYNIRQENVQGASRPGDNERVHIRISPKKTEVQVPPSAPKNPNDAGAKPGTPPKSH